MKPSPGQIFWLFGLSGAGKSTLANALVAQLRAEERTVLPLDGDVVRAGLCRGLGFSDEDRAENLRRSAEVARLAAEAGVCVVASFITPLATHRTLVATVLGRERVSFVHVSAPLEICRLRDTKGLYAGATAGRVVLMTGVSSGFEAPTDADLVIDTARHGIAESHAHLLAFCRTRLPASA